MRPTVLCRVLLGLLALGLWVEPAAAQDAAAQAALAAQIESKRMEIRHHTDLIQGIQDPALLQRETQKHFRMMEQMLALVLEQQKQMLQLASAPSTGAMGGMEGEDAMEMPSAPTPAGMPPAGTPGGMGGGMMGGMGGGHEMMGMGGMKGGAASDPASMAAASAAALRISEREALLKEIDTHLVYLATITDPATRARETVKHQEMLDRLLDMMR